MKHLGDITKIDGHKVPLVDIVTGGSPCQDLSVAGKRAGLAGERSGLFMEQIRIIKEMRDESAKQLHLRGTNEYIRPRFMVWENVPGAFSSNKGEDFRAVLEETARVSDQNAIIPRPKNGKWTPSGAILGNGWSIAWRVHDAQFWGVPQRRKRIALVADFGGSTAPEILFERKSVSGDSEESGEAWQDTSGNIKKCAGDAIGVDAYNQSVTGEVSKSITCSATDSDHVPSVFCIQGNCIDRADTAGCNGKGWRENQSYTLNTIDRPAVCVSQDAYDKYSISEKAATIKQSGGINGGGSEALCIQKVTGSILRVGCTMDSIVRRLTQLECERLQGYPDGWTDIGEWTDSKGKLHKDADSQRYKALGNSIALPFWEWMSERMVSHIDHPATMASLFDGIGGFPLVFSRCGCDPVWASEIEEFPIAVTKIRFPDGVEGEDKE